MGRLDEFLQAVQGTKAPFTSVKAEIRQWTDHVLAEKASDARYLHGRRKPSLEPKAVQELRTIRIASVPNDRARIEVVHQSGSVCKDSLLIVNGGQWWMRDNQGHVDIPRERDRLPPLTTIERHFSHYQLQKFFEALMLREIGVVETAGCACLRIRAIYRSDATLPPHWLPYGADEYEFHAEPERGVLLSIVGLYDGKPFEKHEVVDVRFDELIPDESLTYVPARSEQVRPSVPVVERINLETERERVPFTVLVPSQSGGFGTSRLYDLYFPHGLRRSRAKLKLYYSYYENDSLKIVQLEEAATADPFWEAFEWQTISHKGRDMRISDPEVADGARLVAFEQVGTHVLISLQMSLAMLLDIAASLQPMTT